MAGASAASDSDGCGWQNVTAPPTNEQLVGVFKQTLKLHEPKNGLSDIVGLEDMKEELLHQFRVNTDSKLPKNLSDNKILLFGLSGCGKTSLVHGLAKAFNANLLLVPPSVVSLWTERMDDCTAAASQYILEECRNYQPTIIFLPRLDMCYYFSHEEVCNVNEFVRGITSAWNSQCDTSKLIVIATMCQPKGSDDEDAMFFETFQTRLYVPPLSYPERKDLIVKLVKSDFEYEVGLTEEELAAVARQTKYAVAAEIVNLAKRAVHVQYQYDPDSTRVEKLGFTKKKRAVTKGDFDFVLNRGFLTFAPATIQEFEQSHATYGNGPFIKFSDREGDAAAAAAVFEVGESIIQISSDDDEAEDSTLLI